MTMAKTKFRFSIFGLSHRSCRRSEVTVGSEGPFQKFWKGIFVQEGSSWTHCDHGQFEIRTFPLRHALMKTALLLSREQKIILNLKEGRFSTMMTFEWRLKGLTKNITVHVVHNLRWCCLLNDIWNKWQIGHRSIALKYISVHVTLVLKGATARRW